METELKMFPLYQSAWRAWRSDVERCNSTWWQAERSLRGRRARETQRRERGERLHFTWRDSNWREIWGKGGGRRGQKYVGRPWPSLDCSSPTVILGQKVGGREAGLGEKINQEVSAQLWDNKITRCCHTDASLLQPAYCQPEQSLTALLRFSPHWLHFQHSNNYTFDQKITSDHFLLLKPYICSELLTI